MEKIRSALVDLDGTLLDTAGDLAAAANRMLAALGRAPRTQAQVATYIGKGIVRLVERALTGELDRRAAPELMERALPLFMHAYEEESGGHSRVYPGVAEGLAAFAEAGIALGCVTNKAARFTLPLLERVGLKARFRTIVCGDEVERGKPDPMGYLLGCRRLGAAPQETLVVGDSDNDVSAARAAGMRVLCVPYGYNEGRPVESLGADAVVGDLLAAAAYARRLNASDAAQH